MVALPSDNYVTVNLEGTNGGDINTNNGDTEVFVCPDSSTADTIHIESIGATGDNFVFA